MTRWTLGEHGSVEIERWFEVAGDGGGNVTGYSASGWLVGPAGDLVRIEISATPASGTSVLSLRTLAPRPALWERDPGTLHRLERAALSELAEELRWQASRTEQTTV